MDFSEFNNIMLDVNVPKLNPKPKKKIELRFKQGKIRAVAKNDLTDSEEESDAEDLVQTKTSQYLKNLNA